MSKLLDLLKEKPSEVDVKYSRFEDSPWLEESRKNATIVVGGIGNIGSWLTLFLSRTNPMMLNVVDFDRIEPHNIGGQFYSDSQNGEYKGNALLRNCIHFGAENIKVLNNKIEDVNGLVDTVVPGGGNHQFFFSCFDKIEPRKNWFEMIKAAEKSKNCYFIDGRANIENFQMIVINMHNPQDVAFYEREYLALSDEDIPDAPCNFKSTTHCGAMLANMMVSVYTNILSNISENLNIRTVPKVVNVNLLNFSYEVI